MNENTVRETKQQTEQLFIILSYFLHCTKKILKKKLLIFELVFGRVLKSLIPAFFMMPCAIMDRASVLVLFVRGAQSGFKFAITIASLNYKTQNLF